MLGIPPLTFAIIGCMKCGTTTLARALAAHDLIHVPEREVHFFDHVDSYLSVWRDGMLDPDALEEAYGRHFRTQKPIVGSKTPSYIISTAALERLQRFHPDAKLIVMLRDPVARAQSHWNHLLRARQAGRVARGAVAPTFAEQIEQDERELASARRPAGEISHVNVLYRGLYAEQIRRLQRLYPAERILVGFLEELRDHAQSFFERSFDFLGVPFRPEPLQLAAGGNGAPPHREKLDQRVRERLREFYAPSAAELRELLGGHVPPWELG